MSSYLALTQNNLDEKYSKPLVIPLQENEIENARKICENKTNMASLWKWSVMPIRTDLRSLVKDLFTPTLINGAIKTHDTSKARLSMIETVFLWHAAIVWDLATLPLRYLTLLPRACYNAFTEPKEHPLISYLKTKNVDVKSIQGEVTAFVYHEKQREDGHTIEETGHRYHLCIANREVPYLRSSSDFHIIRSSYKGT